jgi:hypothetical protein
MGYICVEERVSEAPPCGFAEYMWLYEIVRVVAGGVNPSSNQNHSTPACENGFVGILFGLQVRHADVAISDL